MCRDDAKLANDLGRWLSIVVLVAALAVASLLTVAAVSRRVGEFGALKALGWRNRRLIGQVTDELVTTGLVGGTAEIGLGYVGAAIAPRLTATLDSPTGQQIRSLSNGVSRSLTPTVTHTVAVPLATSVTPPRSDWPSRWRWPEG